MAKGESTENITWPYFEHMHKWFKENKIQDLKMEADITENIECEDKDEEKDDVENTQPKNTSSGEFLVKNNLSLDRIKIQLLTEIKAQQEKNHLIVMESLKSIGNQLNNLKNDDFNNEHLGVKDME